MTKSQIFNKCCDVINSCTTYNQTFPAEQYINLAYQTGLLDSATRDELHYMLYDISNELMFQAVSAPLVIDPPFTLVPEFE